MLEQNRVRKTVKKITTESTTKYQQAIEEKLIPSIESLIKKAEELGKSYSDDGMYDKKLHPELIKKLKECLDLAKSLAD